MIHSHLAQLASYCKLSLCALEKHYLLRLVSLRDVSELKISRLNDVLPSPEGLEYFKQSQENKASFKYICFRLFASS